MDPSINPVVGIVLVIAIGVGLPLTLWGAGRTTEIIENEEVANTGWGVPIALLIAVIIIAAAWVDQSMK